MYRDALAANQNAGQINRERTQMLEGLIVSGSWDASNNTVQALIGDTVAYENENFADSQNKPLILTCTLCSPLYDQAGPVGGERVQCWEAQGGWFCWLELGPDDSPGAPAGERWIMHRSAAQPTQLTFDAYLKFKNDSATPGDSKGSAQILAGGLFDAATTNGWDLKLDDTGKLGTLKSPGGVVIQIDDNVGKVYLGANGLASGNAVMTANDVANWGNEFATDIKTWCSANFQSGTSSPSTSPTVPTPTGSTKIFAED